MKKNSDIDMYQTNLRFDNLNFKLAVLQHLIFEKKVFSPEYDFGDFEEIYYRQDYSTEECDEALEEYIQNALHYFTYLKIPMDLAMHVTELQIAAGDDIYFEINPEECGEDGRFNVDRISDREVSQFPKLKRISFWYMSNNVEGLRKQLRAHKIKVEMGEKEIGDGNTKVIPPLVAMLCLVIAAVGVGGATGKLFSNHYQDYEVTWTTEPVVIDKKEEPTDLDEPVQPEQDNLQSDYDVNEMLGESQKKMVEDLEKINEKLEKQMREYINE